MCNNRATFLYGRINEGFINKATSLIGPLIVGLEGGRINEVSLYMLYIVASLLTIVVILWLKCCQEVVAARLRI